MNTLKCAFLSLYLVFTVLFMSIAPALALDCSLVVREKAGVASSNYPLSFGHVFKKGDVPAGKSVAVEVGGLTLPTQFDIKRHFADGSIRHGVISDVYHKNSFKHNRSSRWRKVLWQTSSLPEVEIRYDLDYLIATQHILSYDRNLINPRRKTPSFRSGI